MRQLIVFLFLILAITGCKKNDVKDSSILHGKYQTKKTLSVTSPIMYVINKQITDSAIINAYLRNHNAISSFTYNSTQLINDILLTIIFESDSLSYEAKNSLTFVAAKKTDYSSNEFLIQSTDSIVFPLSNPPFPTRCDTVGLIIAEIKPLIHYNALPAGTGTYANEVITPRFLLHHQNGELFLPLMSYAYNTSYNYGNFLGSCTAGSEDFWNAKPNNLENNLFASDTIVIQEKSVALIKIQ